MLLTHIFLHISLAYSACNAAAHHRRPGSWNGTGQGQGGGALVAPSDSSSGSASNHTAGGQVAVNQLPSSGTGESTASKSEENVGGAEEGDATGGTTGDTTGGNTGGATNGTTGGDTGATTGGNTGGATGSTPSTSAAASNPSSSSTSSSSTGGSTGGGGRASFTQYGAGDSFGSANCNSASAACGWYSNPGFNAAVSQSFFGTAPGGGAGPACGLCFQLSPEGEGTKSIVVKVNNLCPASGNPLCAADKSDHVNFDLCKDDGAGAALFGSSSTGQVNGTYAQVDCGQWSGSGNLT